MAGYELPRRIDVSCRVELEALAQRQAGVVRRDQLHDCALPRHAVEGMVNAGRWRARGAVVVVFHNGPLTREQQQWAAVLNAGGLAALAARTAASEQGLVGWEATCIEIIIPKGQLVPPGLGIDVKVHESRRFTAADLHPGRELPQVRIERAVVDAASWSHRPRTACGLLAASVQQRATTPPRLRSVLETAGAIRYHALLVRALIDIEGGAQAMSEIDFLRFCHRHGLPRPQLQLVRKDGLGRRRYLDATFTRRDGRHLRVEIDGALHLVVRSYWDDMSRGNELVIGREAVLRFPSYVIHANDQTAIDQLRRALDLSVSARHLAG